MWIFMHTYNLTTTRSPAHRSSGLLQWSYPQDCCSHPEHFLIPQGAPGGGISAVSANAVGNAGGLRLGLVGVSSWRVQLTSPLQKWSHPASSSSSSSSSHAVLAHAVVTMLPKLLFASVELEMFVLVFQKINVFFMDGANKGGKGSQWASFIPAWLLLWTWPRTLWTDYFCIQIPLRIFVNLLVACLFKLSPD